MITARRLLDTLCLCCRSLVIRIRRYFLNLAIARSRRIYPTLSTRHEHVVRILDNVIYKPGDAATLRSEAEAMRYISKHTSVPVPRVIAVWADNESEGGLLMSRCPGEELRVVWRRLTEEQKHRIRTQLRGYLTQLRSLPQPHAGWIGSVSGGPCHDERLSYDPFGPFMDESDFHDWRVSLLDRMVEASDKIASRVGDLRGSLRDDHAIVFTHGDLASNNIIVEVNGSRVEDARVSGLIDWGQSGWRPEYWEYVKSLHGRETEGSWAELVRQIIPAYETEWQLDQEMCLIHGGGR
ncbi:kinase-like protein [Dentipellis sp. KUC8613]|nr:kinase-like protein [Dentipellis sp. KUC8613]